MSATLVGHAVPAPAATAPEASPPRPEPTFPIGLIALDLDGTLVGDDLVLGERTTAAIRAAIRRGVSVSIVTGRMTTSALRFARELSITDPIVGYQGAIIRAVPPDEHKISRDRAGDGGRGPVGKGEGDVVPDERLIARLGEPG